MYNNMSRNDEFSTQPVQTLNPEKPMIVMKNIFPLGNGGFGDVPKHPQHQQKQDLVSEDSTAQTKAVIPTRNHLNQNYGYQAVNQTGPARRKMQTLNNNPWGDSQISQMYHPHPLISVPPPSLPLEQSAWAWAQSSSQYPVRYNNDLSSFTSQPGNPADQKVFDSSRWRQQILSAGAAESVCCQLNPARRSESTTRSPSLSPGQRKVVKKRTSGELQRLLNRKEYETDRLKKAEERAQKLAREEEEVEREKLYKLKTEIRRLEQKRKHQEWQTYQRQERLIRKKEKLNGSVRERSRSGVRSRSVYPQRRRSRSRSRSTNRSRQESEAVRRRRNVSRSSRSRSRVSFRRASFTSRKREQSRSPGRRVLVRRDQDHGSVNENLMKMAGEWETEPATERCVRYTRSRSRSRSPEPRRGKSKSRQERRSREERTVSRSQMSSGASAGEREGARRRYRSRSRERSRSRSRAKSRSQRFRWFS